MSKFSKLRRTVTSRLNPSDSADPRQPRRRNLSRGRSVRRRQLRSEVLEPRQMLTGEDLVRLVLTARDFETDDLLPNAQNLVEVAPDSTQELSYEVPINEIFKLEVAVQDLRDRGSDFGIFRAVADVIVESKGVIEPAIGEVNEIILPDVVNGSPTPSGTVELFLADDPNNKITSTLSQFLGSSDTQVAQRVASAVVSLNPLVTSTSQLSVIATRRSDAGGNSTPGYVIEVIYKDPAFIGLNMPAIQANLFIGSVQQEVVNNEFDVYIDADDDGVADDINPARLFHFLETRNRNVGIGDPPQFNLTQVYGNTRVIAGYDASDSQFDIFDEVGGLGPVQASGIRSAIPDFSNAIAYDAFSIPVRGVQLADNVLVRLDPPDVGDGVLIYGTAQNKEQVPANQIALGASSRFRINIHPPLPSVEASNTSRNILEDADPITIELSDFVEADPGELTYSIESTPEFGSLQLSGSTLIYTPAENAFGSETLTYRVTHESGQFDLGQIAIQIASVNDPPVAVDDAFSTDEDVVLNLTAAQLLENDSDVDAGDSLTIVSVGSASHGTVTLSGTAITYAPDDHFFGSDSFTYVVRDNAGVQRTATVDITVNPVNDLPVVVGELVQTEPGRSLTLPFSQLLANDSAGPLEQDQDLTISAVGTPVRPGSTAVISGDSIIYTPAAGFNGNDSFTYAVSDGFASVNATVTVNVNFVVGPVNVVLPDGVASNITVRRAGSQLEVIDHNDNDAFLVRRPLNTVTSLTITGADDAANQVLLDYASGGLITFAGSSAAITVLGGNTGDDQVTVTGNSSATALLAEANSATPAIDSGLIANLQSGSSSTNHTIAGFESITIDQVLQVSVPSNSILDVADNELHLSSQASVNLSRDTRIGGGLLTSTAALVLGSGETLSGSGEVRGNLVVPAGSNIIASGDLILGDATSASSIDIAGILRTGGHTVTLRDLNAAIVRGNVILGDGQTTSGTLNADNGLTIQPGGQVTGFGEVVTPDDPTIPLLNNGSMSGAAETAPITVGGILSGTGTLLRVRVDGTWNPSDGTSNRLDGQVLFGENSRLLVDIGGTAVGSQHDRYRFNPGASLDGTLSVELINGFSPSAGHQFQILEGTTALVGEFGNLELPALTEGLIWNVTQTANQVTLRVGLDGSVLSDDIDLEVSPTGAITVRGQSGQSIPVAGNTLTLNVTPQQSFVSPEGWAVGPSQTVDGEFVLVATKNGVTLRVAGAKWTNFINRFDVNRSGSTQASDALIIINELNNPTFSDGTSQLLDDLDDPNVRENFPSLFYDVNGDGRVSAVDALQVINRLIELDGASGEPVGGQVASGEPLPASLLAPAEDTTGSPSGQEGFSGTLTNAMPLVAVSRSAKLSSDAVLVDWDDAEPAELTVPSDDDAGPEAREMATDLSLLSLFS